MPEITLVILKDPCTACNIIGNLIIEMLDKLNIKVFGQKLQYTVKILEDLKNVHMIEGLEVEIFPALIIDGEQVTAGNLPTPKELQTCLQLVLK